MNENQLSTPMASGEPLELRSMTITDVEQAVYLLTPGVPGELVLQLLELTAALKRRAGELRERAEAMAVAWIEANGDLVLGDHRYYAGHAKETRCINRQAAVEAALNAVFGDLQAFCDLLCAQPLKPGACRGVLPPDDFGRLFLTEEKLVLKNGKPQKRLLKTNDRFNGHGRQSGEAPDTTEDSQLP